MTDWAPKRFWREVATRPGPDGHLILLDGRQVRTPAKAVLALPTAALAEAVAEEWRAQQDRVLPETMPFTRSANAAIDKVAGNRGAIEAMLADYGDADLTCYRAPGPDALRALQDESWDRLHGFIQARFGVRLRSVTGVLHQPQDPVTLAALAAPMAAMNAFQLAAFHDLVTISGSLVIALAVVEAFDRPETLWQCSTIDDEWQFLQWGDDAEAREALIRRRAAFLHAVEFLERSKANH